MQETPESWRRICGLHVTEVGDVGCVWLSYDKDTDYIRLTDSAFFRDQPFPVICEGINARGRDIPIAWSKPAKSLIDTLAERGANIIPEPVVEDPAFAAAITNELVSRMLSQTFRVSERAAEWRDEYKTFFYDDNAKVPVDSHPLMAATRYAIAKLSWAKATRLRRRNQVNFPRVAIV